MQNKKTSWPSTRQEGIAVFLFLFLVVALRAHSTSPRPGRRRSAGYRASR